MDPIKVESTYVAFPQRHGKHNQRERVSFIGADLRDAWAYGGIFIDCNFSRPA